MTWEGAPRILGWAALGKAPTASAASTSPLPCFPWNRPWALAEGGQGAHRGGCNFPA